MKHEFVAVKHSILEIVGEMNSAEVAGIDTELAEHAVAEVILIIYQLTLFLSRLRVFNHLGSNLDGIVWTRFLTQCATYAFVVVVLVASENETTAVACRHMESRLGSLDTALCSSA